MGNWQRRVAPIATLIENYIDRLRYRVYYDLGGPGPIQIVTYTGFGNSGRVYMKGRVLVDKGITPPSETDGTWRNVKNTWKRLHSREIPGARLRIEFGERNFEVTADEEGMFVLDFAPGKTPPADRLRHEVKATLLSPIPEGRSEPITATGWIIIPSPQADFGVISDVDDTVLVTNATNIIKTAKAMFVQNARTRLPFPGAAAFYRALSWGTRTGEWNPMYYVSSSPWNIYDLLYDFFAFQKFPASPVLFLRNWGISETEILPTDHFEYKLGAIKRILDMHPDLQFFLIGDSGQQDPEIYSRILSEYPGKIRCIYIRNVTKRPKRLEEIKDLARKAVLQNCPLVLADDTLTMARHAAEHGWIRTEMLTEISEEKRLDEAPPTVLQKLTGKDKESETFTVGDETGRKTSEHIEEGAIETALGSGQKKDRTPPKVIIEPENGKDKGWTRESSGT